MTLSSNLALRVFCARARLAHRTMGWIGFGSHPVPWTTGETLDPAEWKLVLCVDQMVGNMRGPLYPHEPCANLSIIGAQLNVAVVRRSWLGRQYARFVWRVFGWRL